MLLYGGKKTCYVDVKLVPSISRLIALICCTFSCTVGVLILIVIICSFSASCKNHHWWNTCLQCCSQHWKLNKNKIKEGCSNIRLNFFLFLLFCLDSSLLEFFKGTYWLTLYMLSFLIGWLRNKKLDCISVTPLLMHWNYSSIILTHWFIVHVFTWVLWNYPDISFRYSQSMPDTGLEMP